MCGIRPESLVSPEQVAPFFVKLNSFFLIGYSMRVSLDHRLSSAGPWPWRSNFDRDLSSHCCEMCGLTAV